MKILCTFSIILESVALIPQLVLIYRAGKAKLKISDYLFVLGFARGFYILDLVYRYNFEDFYKTDMIATLAILIVTTVKVRSVLESRQLLRKRRRQLRQLLRLTDPFTEEEKLLDETEKTGKEKELKEELEFSKA